MALSALAAKAFPGARRSAVVGALTQFQRFASDFAYVKPGKLAPRRHEVDFDESQRDEQWKSSAIPRVSLNPEWVAAADEVRAEHRHSTLNKLRKEHSYVFLVHAAKFLLEEDSAESGTVSPLQALPAEQLEALLAPATSEELEAVSTEHGRISAMQKARKAVEDVLATASAAESQVLEGGLLDAALPASAEARDGAIAAVAARAGLLRAGLSAVRILSIMHSARIAALPPAEQRQAEKEWFLASGLPDLNALPMPFRSPRLPTWFWEVRDRPLDTALTPTERRDSTTALNSGDVSRVMAMEHRDRAEFGSRRRLPTPLHEGAPSKPLADAARVLESNRSLSPADREYMLSFYADALGGKSTAFDFSKEKKAWVDPQPQWGWYDPDFSGYQDDVREAMQGRGKYSAYRGSTFMQQQLPPSMYGEATPAHMEAGTPNTPLETAEEAELAARGGEDRLRAESALAQAAVTAAIERAMGMRPRASTKAAVTASAEAFFSRYKAGERPHAPEPPKGGHRVELERVGEPEAPKGKDAKGKAGAAPAKGKAKK